MTHTDTLRRALRAYDLAGPETPARTAALADVLSAAHEVCARVCTFCAGSGKSDGRECICQVIGLPPEPSTKPRILLPARKEEFVAYEACDVAEAAAALAHNACLDEVARLNSLKNPSPHDLQCGDDSLANWSGSPAPELPTPLQIEVANLRRQLRDTQDELQRARYSPAEHWT